MTDLVVGRWGARYRGRTFPCAVGRGGIGGKRAEGDGVTPAGRHRIETMLRRADRLHGPGTAIGPRDGWSDDPRDPAYNGPVLRPHGFGCEAMRRAAGASALVAVLAWTRNPVRPGRGSAIFLHVWRGPRRPTAGCIAFRRADLAFILAHWRPEDRVDVRGWG